MKEAFYGLLTILLLSFLISVSSESKNSQDYFIKCGKNIKHMIEEINR